MSLFSAELKLLKGRNYLIHVCIPCTWQTVDTIAEVDSYHRKLR